jgi:homogentisate phytyltransferase / homogentisate geranylgeranyltransferase
MYLKKLHILWKFSRPHTVIGSVISIVTLYVLLCGAQRSEHLPLLMITLVAGVTVNVFIVGLNQIADVSIDRINKPWLPIPSGALKLEQAWVIVIASLAISLSLALYITPYFFALVLLSAAIGWAYSMPPFRLKRHHIPAALAISMVRGILVNVGGFVVFSRLLKQSGDMPENLKILTLFITVFAVVIAWFKDLPDVKGDARYRIRTFAVLYSPSAALITGHILLGAAYVFTIVLKYREYRLSAHPARETEMLLLGHGALLILFVVNSFSIRLASADSVKRFYKRFWWFFFAEYFLYMAAYV